MNALKRPMPIMGVYEKPFWEAVQARELRLQKCGSCRHVWYPPGPVCPKCLAEDWSFTRMSGHGRIIAWTVFHRQYFVDLPVPYLVASIELDEGPLMIGNVPGLATENFRVNLPVEVDFEQAAGKDGNWLIVQWRERTQK